MRIFKMYALLVFIIASPNFSIAGWEVATRTPTGPITPHEPFFQSKIEHPSSGMPFRPLRTSSIGLGIPMGAPVIRNGMSPHNSHSKFSSDQPTGIYAVSISGSLKENIERIMSRYHWRVVWKAPYDYNFDGKIVGKSLPNVIEKLLSPFPLHAVLYMSNRTLAITTRSRYKA